MQCPVHKKKLEPILASAASEDQICEICSLPGTLYCKQCKFILCSECRICNARHHLIKIIDLVKVKTEYYNNTYACNGCSKSKTVDDDGIWHCNECNYDMCCECCE